MTTGFDTRRIAEAPNAIAPDGSEVRLLGSLPRGSMAAFRLSPLAVSKPVTHRTVEEIWYFTAGYGRMWRKLGDREEITEVAPGVSITIPRVRNSNSAAMAGRLSMRSRSRCRPGLVPTRLIPLREYGCRRSERRGPFSPSPNRRGRPTIR
jgi:hypothetical protein